MRSSLFALALGFAGLTALGAAAAHAQPAALWTPLNAGSDALPTPVASDIDAAGTLYVLQRLPGQALVRELARWDGTAWTTLPGTPPFYAYDLAVTEAGDAIYIAIPSSGTALDGNGNAVAIRQVARYDIASASWSDLGGGLDGSVEALDTDGAGNLVVGGEFRTSVSGVALDYVGRWNAASGQWEAFGAGVSDPAYAIAAETDGSVVVGGAFSQVFNAGGSSSIVSRHVARFDAPSGVWQGYAGGFDTGSRVAGLVSDGTNVTVTGFLGVGGTNRQVYRWNGTAWSVYANTLDVAINPQGIEADAAGTVYVWGWTSGSGINHWLAHARGPTDAGWTEVARVPFIPTSIRTLAATPRQTGTQLFLGGDFYGLDTPSGTVDATNFAVWNGSAWTSRQPPFIGANGAVHATEEIVRSLDGPVALRGIAVGGDFSDIAGTAANRIARYDGSTWDDPGQGVTDPAGVVQAILSTRNTVPDLFRHSNRINAPLVIGGQFDEVTNEDGTPVPAGNVAMWSDESETWDAFGGGVSFQNGNAATVHALGFFPGCGRFADQAVYVAGAFDTATNPGGATVAVRNVARFNLVTRQWESIEGGTDGPVYALKVFNGRRLGSSNATGDGLDDHVLVIGGQFSRTFDQDGTRILDTENLAWLDHRGDWQPMGRGTNGPVFALEGYVERFGRSSCLAPDISNFTVYVGGSFASVNSNGPQVPASNLAKWSLFRSPQWEVMGLPFGQASGTPGNGVNGFVRSLQLIEGLSDFSYGGGGKITLAVGGLFTEAYDEYGATIASPNAVRLVDHAPTWAYPTFDEPWTRGAEVYEPMGGGADDEVLGIASTTCQIQVGSFFGATDTYYVGGRFRTVGGSIASPGLAKWRDVLPPPPVTAVTHVGRTRRGSSGGTRGVGAVRYVYTNAMRCPSPSLGRTASGGEDVFDLGAPAFGETVTTAGTNPEPDTPLRFEITDEDGTVIGVDTVTVETTGPVAFLVTGVDEPGEYAANPDGRDIRLGVRAVQIGDRSLTPAGQATLRFVNAVTDAPPLDVTLLDGTLLADSLAYDSLSTSVRVPFGTPSVEVRRHSDGTLLGTFDLDVPEAEPVQVVALAGFLDPAANQNGPELTLVAVPLSDEGAVADEASSEADAWALLPPSPNPVTTSAEVRFVAPEVGRATVEVFDALGRRVAALHDGPVAAGTHTATWDVRDATSGTYLVRLRAGAVSVARTVTVVR